MTIKEFKIQLALGSLSIADKIRLSEIVGTSKEILTMLSKDEDWNIRGWIADNPNTPIEVLIKLSKDDNCTVRYWVTKNPRTPIEILKKLSNDKNDDVRHGTAVQRTVQILKEKKE